ncbi:hypothetical protein LB503_009891 [Fusarium chuoi]|nr:hypothetical protein LB503_009891 [Fusarium chuoi]
MSESRYHDGLEVYSDSAAHAPEVSPHGVYNQGSKDSISGYVQVVEARKGPFGLSICIRDTNLRLSNPHNKRKRHQRNDRVKVLRAQTGRLSNEPHTPRRMLPTKWQRRLYNQQRLRIHIHLRVRLPRERYSAYTGLHSIRLYARLRNVHRDQQREGKCDAV